MLLLLLMLLDKRSKSRWWVNKTSQSLISVECSSCCLFVVSLVFVIVSLIYTHSKDETTAQSFAHDGKLKNSNHETRTTRISFRERRGERRRRRRTRTRLVVLREETGSSARAEDARALVVINIIRKSDDDQIETLGKNKENITRVPLPRFALADYSSPRKKPHLWWRLVSDVTREDRRPGRCSPPFGGFRPACFVLLCVSNSCRKSAFEWWTRSCGEKFSTKKKWSFRINPKSYNPKPPFVRPPTEKTEKTEKNAKWWKEEHRTLKRRIRAALLLLLPLLRWFLLE